MEVLSLITSVVVTFMGYFLEVALAGFFVLSFVAAIIHGIVFTIEKISGRELI